ncbi:MAG: magnesium transporter [Planctomycetota bacterium]
MPTIESDSQAPPPVADDAAARALSDAIDRVDVEAIQEAVDRLPAEDRPRILDQLGKERLDRLVTCIEPGDAAHLLETLPDAAIAATLERIDPGAAAQLLERLPSAERADLVQELSEDQAESVLDALPEAIANEARALSGYDPETAGGLLVTEVLSYADDRSVGDVVEDMRANAERYRAYDVQYAFVTDAAGRLRGVLRLRDLLLAPWSRRIAEIMIPDPIRVSVDETLDDLESLFDDHGFFGVPAVDTDDRLVGVVQRSRVEEALAERSESDYRKSQGIIGGEELRSMPTLLRARRRFAWLSINIVLNSFAAAVIALNEATLEAVIALAVFMPIISDMSGCSGNQAVAVSMRELTLGLIKPRDALRVWRKELSVGVINGLGLGLLLMIGGSIYAGNIWFGAVVGSALTLNTLIALSVGGLVPILLKAIKKDPALASGPILTTVTDMCGFLLVLTLASLMMDKLL